MKRSTLLLIAAPPAVLIAAIVVFNPAILTWPMVALLAVFLGGVAAAVQHLAEPHD